MRTVSENEAELVARSPAPDTTDVTSGQSDCFILWSETTFSFRPLYWLSGIPWEAITWQLLNLFVELLIYVHVKIRSKYAVKYKVGKSAVYMSCKNNSTLFWFWWIFKCCQLYVLSRSETKLGRHWWIREVVLFVKGWAWLVCQPFYLSSFSKISGFYKKSASTDV